VNPELASHVPMTRTCDLCDPVHCACAIFDNLRKVLPEYRQQEADRIGVHLDGSRKAAKVIYLDLDAVERARL
jgi:hypothetical protein